MIKNIVCPRCFGAVPSNENPGAYIGALSRTDNKTEICSRCGTDEAMEDYLLGEVMPQSEWKVNQNV